MIQAVACDIGTRVMATGYINRHYEYAEMIRVGEDVYPAQYTSAGQYDDIFRIDVNGHSYLRKNGKITFGLPERGDNIKLTSCGGDDFITLRLPLRLVLTVPKLKLSDDAFSDERLASEIMRAISGTVELSGVDAREIKYTITDYDTDSLSVWNAEVQGPKHQMNFNYSYIAVGLSVDITINPACMDTLCSGRAEAGTIYYGNSTDTALNAAGVEALGTATGSTFSGTFSYAAGSGVYKYFAYPTSFGTPSEFRNVDSQFPVVMDTPYNVTIDGVDYTVYRSLNSLSGAINMEVV